MEVEERAVAMLKFMALVRQAVLTDDPLALPYLEAGAVMRTPEGDVVFHKTKFLELISQQISLERIGDQ